MSLARARDYIKDLHRRQTNPYLWPDYLTGLPDKAAILHRLDEVYPKLGRMSIAYVRIRNVDPFLVKYGSSHHADIVQWAAAILKTVAEDHNRRNFVGALETHDFVVMARTDQIDAILKKASQLFRRRAQSFYKETDRKKGYLVSFRRDRKQVRIGLMELIHVVTSSAYGIPQSLLLPHLEDRCAELEDTGETGMVLRPHDLQGTG